MTTGIDKTILLDALRRLGNQLESPQGIEITLVGAAAGIALDLLPSDRRTIDCDVIRFRPENLRDAVLSLGPGIAQHLDLEVDWLNDRARQLNILPDGWLIRRHHVGTWGRLKVYAVDRKDLLAMKVYACRAQDRKDVINMRITPEEIEFVAIYLKMLTVPSREANLDQVQSATRFLNTLREQTGG